MERINEPAFACAHLLKLLCKRLLAFRDHILGSLLFRFFNVHRTTCRFDVRRHAPRHILIFADQMRRVAKLMPLRVPKEVQQQKLSLTGREARASTHHLSIQAADLRRPEHYDAIHRGAIPSLRE